MKEPDEVNCICGETLDAFVPLTNDHPELGETLHKYDVGLPDDAFVNVTVSPEQIEVELAVKSAIGTEGTPVTITEKGCDPPERVPLCVTNKV